MDSFYQPHMVSHIHLDEDHPVINSTYWSDFDLDINQLHNAHRFEPRIFNNEIVMSNSNTELNSMERYLRNPDPVPGFLCLNFGRPTGSPTPYHPTNFGYAQQFQTHLNEYRRANSPSATSSSGSQSLGPNEDIKAVHLFHNANAYGTPPSDPGCETMPYFSQDIFSSGSTVGGGVTLQDIQGVPDTDPNAGEEQARINIEFVHPKMKVEIEQAYTEDDSSYSPIAESVHCYVPDEDGTDPDYKPPSRASKRGRKRDLSQSSHEFAPRIIKKAHHSRTVSSISSPETPKRKLKRADKTRPPASAKNSGDTRPFPCPLAIYSCTSTFASKNEWKRHVSTQHVRIGFWRCDLCLPSHDPTLKSVYYNEFNRKDLFTQHLRRMHSTTATDTKAVHSATGKTATIPPVDEANIPAHQDRCFRRLRSPPPSSSCLFCPAQFSGPASWDERMEHVGKHFERNRKTTADTATWNEDTALEDWLLKEGLVERVGEHWKLGDGVPRKGSKAEDEDEDVDADGEEEL